LLHFLALLPVELLILADVHFAAEPVPEEIEGAGDFPVVPVVFVDFYLELLVGADGLDQHLNILFHQAVLLLQLSHPFCQPAIGI
jgi:hypothetical protein